MGGYDDELTRPLEGAMEATTSEGPTSPAVGRDEWVARHGDNRSQRGGPLGTIEDRLRQVPWWAWLTLFVAVAVNVALKILLMDRYAQVGLAFATSAGAWVNLLLLAWFSARRNFLHIDRRLQRSSVKFVMAGAILGGALLLGERPVEALFAGWPMRNEMTVLLLAVIGAIIYGIAIGALFRREWRDLMSGRLGSDPSV